MLTNDELGYKSYITCIVSSLKGFIKSVGEEYQVVMSGKEYHECGEEFNMVKREMVSNIIFPTILRLFGRISSEEEVKGTEILGKKIKI